MKNRILSLLVALTLLLGHRQAVAQGAAFTYQGQLNANGTQAGGSYDLTFTLYTNSSGGTATAGPITNLATAVSNGLFTATIDFGANAFTGASNWLQIGARTNGTGAFTPLTPRQQVTPTPYALYAPNAGLAATAGSADSVAAANVSGTLALAQLPAAVLTNGMTGASLTGTFTGNGANVTNIPFSGLASGGSLGLVSNGVSFILAATNQVGNDPYVVVAATNLNGKGLVDMVTANSGDNSVSVLTNNGSGGFATYATLPVGANPQSVAVADVNNDGKPDLICANFNVSTLTVYTNTGSGFVSNATVALSNQPSCVVAADVNGDGWVDLICANGGPGNLTILTNNRSGGFVFASTQTTGPGTSVVVAADLNNNNIMDLIAANTGASGSGQPTLTVLINNGSGTFQSSNYTVGSAPDALLAVDVNGDGWVDLVSANTFGGSSLTVLTNNRNGTFTLAYTVSTAGSVGGLAAADVNGDGRPDLICGMGSSILQLYYNTGNGTFMPGPTLTVNTGTGYAGFRSVAARDVNGDGKPDLVTSASGSNFLAVLLNNSGLSSTELTLAGQSGGWSLSPGLGGVPNLIGGCSANEVVTDITGAVIAGGGSTANINQISSSYSSISGGEGNTILTLADHSSIGGGEDNMIGIESEFTCIGGGFDNIAQGDSAYAVISGGASNLLFGGAFGASIGGGLQNSNGGQYSFIGGGSQNYIIGNNSVIGGGLGSTITASYATVAGGENNKCTVSGAAVGGGNGNMSSGMDSVVGGGSGNSASGNGSFIGGGGYNGTNVQGNSASGAASVIGGGYNNANTGNYATVGGGINNLATNFFATVPGGSNNVAGGQYSFAAGANALATNSGSFVWADNSTGTPFASTNNNSFNLRATGGVRIATTTSGAVGVLLPSNGTSWSSLSDRNAKKNFQPVDTKAVMDKLAAIPIQQWNYKWENDTDVPNIGPMAQDFKQAFYPGRDDKSISTLEFDGVELAAIQGVNQKVLELKSENARLQEQNAALEKRLQALEHLVQSLANK